jgi:multicomponent Na+:H+ antiporter subunit D
LILSISSAGTFLHTGLKLPYFTFFAKDSGIRAKEPPLNMLIAMGIASFLCILIGVYPDALYNLLPFAASYVPYTAEHIVWTLQILLFTALGFFMLLKHLGGEPYITMDTDWLYRKGAAGFLWLLDNPLAWFGNQVKTAFFETIPQSLTWFSRNPLLALKMAGDNIVLTLFEESFTNEKVERIRKQIREEMSVYPGSVISYSEVGITIVWVMGLLLGYLIISFVCGIIAV